MENDTLLPFALPSVQRKKVVAAFDGGRISSNGGVMLLSLAERRLMSLPRPAVGSVTPGRFACERTYAMNGRKMLPQPP